MCGPIPRTKIKKAWPPSGDQAPEVELRARGVAQRTGVNAAVDGRAVGADVVSDQLSEERRPPGVVVAVGVEPVQGCGGVPDPAGCRPRASAAGVGAQRVQVREDSPVAGGAGGPVHGAYQAEAVVAGGHAAAVRV